MYAIRSYYDPFKLVEKGRFREDAVRSLLTEAPYPARNPSQNIADLKAQVAAIAGDDNSPAGWGKFDRVMDQVDEYLRDPIWVGLHLRQFLRRNNFV